MPIRNQVVRHAAILRKGGAHTSSVSGQRGQSKRQLDDEIDDYFNQSEDTNFTADQQPDQHQKTKKGTNKKTNKGRSNSAPSSFCLLLNSRDWYQACA